MQILKDDEIFAAIEAKEIEIKNFDLPADPYDKNSPIQPSSLDLTIGEVFLPAEERNAWAKHDPRDTEGCSLRQGHTALVYTQEVLKLRDDIGAFSFPPARVSSTGLLMTNPGHIDPGYEGKLKFTVINMARDAIDLKPGEVIVTLLLYRMAARATKGYLARGFSPAPDPPQPKPLLQRLSHDFVGVEQRARDIARKEMRKAGVVTAMLVAIVAIAGGIFGVFGQFHLADIRERLGRIEASSQVDDLLDQVSKISEDHEQFRKQRDQFKRETGQNEIPEPPDNQAGDASDP